MVLDAGALGVVLHWSDGDLSAIGDGEVSHPTGKHLDQLRMVEIHPSGGGQVDKTTPAGTQVRVLEMTVPGMPCPVRIVFPIDVAKQIGSNLADKPYVETALSLDELGL